MSMSREGVLLSIVINLVLTAAIVAGVVAFLPGSAADRTPPPDAGMKESLAGLERTLQSMENALKADRLAVDSRLIALERALAAAPAGKPEEGAPAAAGGLPGSPTPPTEGELMGRMMGEMMRQQVKRGRDRYVDELLNPTPETQARSERQMRGIVGQIATAIGLDEAEKAAVERVLMDVDARRRERLRPIFQAKPREQIGYADIKDPIEESFREEDQLIAQVLSPEKAEEYRRNAEPFRQFITSAAQMAFPSAGDPSGR